MSITKSDFDLVRKLVYERSGIALGDGKEYLVDSRLIPVAEEEGFSSVSGLVAGLLREPHFYIAKIVDALTTNETSFFRDSWPFQAIVQDILPDLMQKRASARTLNIWCAASSSGQEPYTLAMMIRDQVPELINWNLSIRATDISDTMLDRCRKGEFSQLEVNRGLPADLLSRYFKKDGNRYLLDESIKSMVSFEKLNLIEIFPRMPTLDLVMIRNVLIYFDDETKKDILDRVTRCMSHDGYLMLGTAETMQDPTFDRIAGEKTSYYRRAG